MDPIELPVEYLFLLPGYVRGMCWLLDEHPTVTEWDVEEVRDEAQIGWLSVELRFGSERSPAARYFFLSPLGRVWGGSDCPYLSRRSPVELGLPLLRDADYDESRV